MTKVEVRAMLGRMMVICLTIETISLVIPARLEAQTTKDDLSLGIAAVDSPQVGKPAGIWLVIRNETERVRFLCRTAWSYSMGIDDPNAAATGGAEGGIHSCLNERDGFLLLPKESRLERVELELRSLNRNLVLIVDVYLIERLIGSPSTAIDKSLSWRGTLAESIALGQKVRNGKLE